MPVSVIPSSGQTVEKQKTTARKRRRNQNVEIDELATLIPLSTPLAPPSDSPSTSLVPSNGKSSAIDKISVLRLTSTFLKLQNFMKDTAPVGPSDQAATYELLRVMEEAMDGFLIVLDKEANILYASETITGYVGLSQQDVIGQNLADITHPESAVEITDNLKPAATPPTSMVEESIVSQFRQFYVRFRSTVSPSRMQLSRFTSHTMVQVNGNLKVRLPPSKKFGQRDVELVEPSVIGFVGECRLIESASSIIELPVPHSTFTMTKSLDMKIISVESTVKDIVGYEPEDLLGDSVNMVDFFHPADYKRMVPCEKFLMRTGHAVSPHFRFLTSSGDWVWMQLEATLRYKNGTKIPQFWEVKCRVLSQHSGGKLKYVEQNELYASNPDPDQDLLNPHRDHDIATKLANRSTHCKEEGAKPIIDSFKGTKLPDSVLEPVLHARSMAMSNFPSEIKPVLTPDEADEFVAQRDKVFAEMMKRNDSTSSMASSPLSASSPDSGMGSMMGGASPASATNSIIGRGSVSSRNGSLSSSSVASPLSSVSSPPISPPTQSSAAPSPNTPATAQVADIPPPQTTLLASMPKQQGQFTQLQRERLPTGGEKTVPKGVQEYITMLTAPSSSSSVTATSTTNSVMEDQNGVQSPPSVGSSLSSVSSPPSSVAVSANQMQQQLGGGSFGRDGQFVSSGGGSFSETPSPYNSAISAVSSPPSVFSPESNMGTGMLHSAVSTNSIPSVSSGLPFQNFHAQNFIPQATTANTSMNNSFNTQIPSNFNFNGTTSAYHPITSSAANGRNSTSVATNFNPENQMYVDNPDQPLLNPNDPVMHQLLSDMVALNSSDPSFNAVATVPPPTNGSITGSATNVNTSFSHTHPQAPGNYHHNNFVPSNTNLHASAVVPPRSSSHAQPNLSGQANNTFAMSCDIALTQLNVGNSSGHGGGTGISHLLANPQVPNSNPEVQDILQQFQ